MSIVHCSFRLGKSRLAPIKSVSIPKLELTAAVLAVRLSCLLKAELDLPVVLIFWTDSTAVLHCTKNKTKPFPVFVANRLAIIKQNTELDCWRHVPSNLNPADLASRGVRANSNEMKKWLEGPEFLTKPRTEWPTNTLLNLTPPEEFISTKEQTVCSALESRFTGELNSIDRFINRCSNLYKLKRLTAWILKYKFFLQNRSSFDCKLKILKQITVEDLQNAEIELVKYTQRQHFPYLFTKTSSHRWHLFMRKINPIFLDGVARVGGRLAQLDIDVDMNHPIIMPQCSHLTELVIKQHHDKFGHAGTSHTWASLRQRFWIVKGAAAVRHSIGQCIKCKRLNASVGKQLMADPLRCRVQTDKPPFYKVVVDYFGPFLVKQGRSRIKRYGCIFSCLTTRAVHVEVASDLSTDSFINALRRFIARRGQPDEIFSDIGINFVGAERVLRESLWSLQQSKLNNFCRQLEIKWRFNPLYASHMGGAWERMCILNALTQMQIWTEEGLVTLMTEVEGILNSRSLVPLMLHDSEEEPLTPNHLLLLRGNLIYRLAHSTQIAVTHPGVGLKCSF